MSLRKTFIENMKFYRKSAGLTQEKLAEAIGMSTSYIGDMEARERFPSAETIEKIAGALKIEPSVLFNEKGCPANIHANFKDTYGSSLKEMLTQRILLDISDVCDKL